MGSGECEQYVVRGGRRMRLLWVVVLAGLGGALTGAQDAPTHGTHGTQGADEPGNEATCDPKTSHPQCLDPKWVAPCPHETCASGCGAFPAGFCCDAGCCAESASCVAFNLNTVHVVVEGDDPIAQSHGHHITLPVGSSVMVACRHGFIVAPDRTHLNGRAPLSCTGVGPYASTELVCIEPYEDKATKGPDDHAVLPPGTAVDGGPSLSAGPGAPLTTVDPGHDGKYSSFSVIMVLLLGVVVATVVGKHKLQFDSGRESNLRRTDGSNWHGSTSSTGSISLRLAFGGTGAEINLRSSLMTEGQGFDGGAAEPAAAPSIVDLESAPSIFELESDQDSCNGTDVYTSGEEGIEIDAQSVHAPAFLCGPHQLMFPGCTASSESEWESESDSSTMVTPDPVPVVMATAGAPLDCDDLLSSRSLTADEISSLPLLSEQDEKIPVLPMLTSWDSQTVMPPELTGPLQATPSHSLRKSNNCLCPESGCGYVGATKSHLERHMRSHNGVRPFKCTVPGCGYSATQKVHLDTHALKHSTAKPFKCPECDFATKRKEHLTRHVRTRHANKHPEPTNGGDR